MHNLFLTKLQTLFVNAILHFYNDMHTFTFRSLVLIKALVSAYSNAMLFDEGCDIKEPIALQVAFVMDRTGTFFTAKNGTTTFFERFEKVVPKLMNDIDKEYPGTQFALTLFADWDREAGPDFDIGHDDRLVYCIQLFFW